MHYRPYGRAIYCAFEIHFSPTNNVGVGGVKLRPKDNSKRFNFKDFTRNLLIFSIIVFPSILQHIYPCRMVCKKGSWSSVEKSQTAIRIVKIII